MTFEHDYKPGTPPVRNGLFISAVKKTSGNQAQN